MRGTAALMVGGVLLAGLTPGVSEASAQQFEWRQVWGDEFDYTGAPDPSKWGYEIGYIRNNEAQYYTDRPENVRVENGVLVIEARKESYSGYGYTSASIHTLSTDRQTVLFSTTCGRLEIRAKLPSTLRSWAAFWTLGTDTWTPEGTWPDSGEIDVLEYLTHTPQSVFANLHYKGADGTHKSASGDYNVQRDDRWDAPMLHTDFHTFRIDWHADRIEWYIDDRKYHEVSLASLAVSGSPFNSPHYLILNLAVGGDWGGMSGIASDFTTDQFLVDYVRVYHLTPVPEPAASTVLAAICALGLVVASQLAKAVSRSFPKKSTIQKS
jgi:beta-glucanase (GH16 family)